MHATPPSRHRVRYSRDGLRRAIVGAALFGTASGAASAYTVSLNAATPKAVYLQVGVGSFTNTYLNGGQPGNNTAVNGVSVTVPSAVVGNGTAQNMTTDSTATLSFWDNYAFCNLPSQVYIGGFYRTTGGTTTAAQVTATVPAALTSATGQTIPFSKIRWATSGNGDTGGQPFPAGTFVNGGVQNVGAMASNTWDESCWAFSYSNDSVPAAGTFTGTVRYTLSSP
jgi:hypothetical protein